MNAYANFDERECARLVHPRYREGLKRYFLYGIRPGSFLQAVLSNDFVGAIHGADDDITREDLRRLALFIYNYTTGKAWGDPSRVENWIAVHRAEREAAEARQ